MAIEPREFLTRAYLAGVKAADPHRVTREAVAQLGDLAREAWVFAIGKGSHGMASGAVEALRERGVPVRGGLVVAHAADPSATHGLEFAQGDHPTPGDGSFRAADRLGAIAASVEHDADAIVLVSGGATSLIAAPIEGITGPELVAAFETLLASGADISLMNAIRKRLLRFGGGRLALALPSRRVHCLIASDVIGNDPASIASGPCVTDSSRAGDVRERAVAAGVWDRLSLRVRQHIETTDLPRPDHARFVTTAVRVILDRTHAEHGAAEEALRLGAQVQVRSDPLSGNAATVGQEFARQLVTGRRQALQCIIWSGETTVTLPPNSGRGGRCQEFALACALALENAGDAAKGITVLAAGTDGRDGPTDAAGAIVDGSTCSAIRQTGTEPAALLPDHASYNALDSVGALLRTGPTGTNVNDLVISLLS